MRPALICIFFAFINVSIAQRQLRPFESVDKMFPFDNKVILFASDGVHGRELWISDGTGSGTVLLKDIGEGNTNGVDDINSRAVPMNGYLYFRGNTRDFGSELWRTDGTEAGTTMVIDLQPNEPNPINPSYEYFGSDPSPVLTFKDKLYFIANIPHSGQRALYSTDGTADGTTQVNSSGTYWMKATNSYLYMANSYGDVMYTSDGTSISELEIPDTGGSTYVLAMEPGPNGMFVVIGNYPYPNGFARLYYINESTGNFELMKDFSGAGEITVSNLKLSGDKLFFTAAFNNNDSKDQLWTSDGTAAGTKMIYTKDYDPYLSDDAMSNFYAYKDGVVFVRETYEEPGVWYSDGSVAAPKQLSDKRPSTYYDYPIPTAITDDFYYLTEARRIVGLNTGGVTMSYPFVQMTYGYYTYYSMTAVGDRIFFSGDDGYGIALWTLDPAPEIDVSQSSYEGDYNGIPVGGERSYVYAKADTCYKDRIYIKSVGQSDLLISQISVSGSDWYLNDDANVPAVVKPGEYYELLFTFTPAKEGLRAGSLTIYSNDENESIYTVNLRGEAKGIGHGCLVDTLQKVKVLLPHIDHTKLQLDTDVIDADAIAGTAVGNFSVNDEAGTFAYEFVADENSDNGLFTIDGNTLKTAGAVKLKHGMFTVRVRATRPDLTFIEDVFIIKVKGNPNPAPDLPCWEDFSTMNFAVTCVAVNSVGDFFASGPTGKLLYSNDHGATWKERNLQVAKGYWYSFTDIRFTGKLGIAQNNSRYYVLRSTDDGETWSPIGLPPSGDPIGYVSFVNEKVGFGVDNAKRVWRTIDSGTNWDGGWVAQVYDPVTPYAVDENTVFFGSDLTLYKSVDAGKTWKTTSLPEKLTTAKVQIISSANWRLIGATGIYETTDGGAYWFKKGSPPNDAGLGITLVSASGNELVVNTGNIFKSVNGGADWTKVYDYIPNGPFGAVALDGDYWVGLRFYALYDEDGRSMFRSTNGGSTWEQTNYLPDSFFPSVSFPTENTGYVTSSYQYGGGPNGPIYKTTDGGITWHPIAEEEQFSTVYFRDELTGFANKYEGMFKTTNGGEDWHQVHNTGGSKFIFFDDDNGVMMGQYVSWTDDGGETWTDGFEAGGYLAGDMFFVNSQVGYLTKLFATIYKTIDGGRTWDEIKNNDEGYARHDFGGIWFFDEQNGIVGGEDGKLYHTTDGGDTWTISYTEMSGTVEWIYVRSTGEVIAVSEIEGGRTVWSSSDGGQHFRNLSWGYEMDPAAVQITENTIYVTASSFGYDNFLAKHVRGSSNPTPPVISGPSVVCLGDAAQFQVAVNEFDSFEWTFDGPGGLTTNGVFADTKFTGKGTFNIGARTKSGCGVSDFVYATVEVRDLPAPVIDGPVEVKGVGKFSVKDPVAAMDYTWGAVDPRSIQVSGYEATIKWNSAMNSVVQLAQTDPESLCRATTAMKVLVTEGAPPDPDDDPDDPDDPDDDDPDDDDPVTGLESSTILDVYPNPSDGIVYITIPEGANGDAMFFDPVGRQLPSKPNASGAGLISYDVSDYASGIYFIKVKLSTGQEFKSRLAVR